MSISQIRDLISKTISVKAEDLKIYYNDKELKILKKTNPEPNQSQN